MLLTRDSGLNLLDQRPVDRRASVKTILESRPFTAAHLRTLRSAVGCVNSNRATRVASVVAVACMGRR